MPLGFLRASMEKEITGSQITTEDIVFLNWPFYQSHTSQANEISVYGLREHEAIIKDAKKCKSLGLDEMFEEMIYFKRWGNWLE